MKFRCVIHRPRRQRSSFNMENVFLEQGWRRHLIFFFFFFFIFIFFYPEYRSVVLPSLGLAGSFVNSQGTAVHFWVMVVNTIHWFRKGLRLHDNPSLLDSVRGADTLRFVYILDPWFAGSSNVGINRWRWVSFGSDRGQRGPDISTW